MERVRPTFGAGLGITAALAAALLAGCSTVVTPKNAAASVSPSSSAPASSSVAASSSASPTPTPSTTVAGKDVDHAVCANVRIDIADAKDKAAADKASPKKAGTDLKTLGSELKAQATKTKVATLKTALTSLGTEYVTFGTDTSAGRSTTADESKISDTGAKLDELCAEKPTS